MGKNMEDVDDFYTWMDNVVGECVGSSDDLLPIAHSTHIEMADDRDSNSGCSRDSSNNRLLQSLKAQLKVSVYVNYGLLTVHLMQARHLKSKYQPTCETYIKLSLVPDQSRRTQCKTDIVHDTNHPVFDEKFSFELLEEDSNKRLLISVWNRYKSRSEFLGCMSFGLHRIQNETRKINGWYYLLPEDLGRRKHLTVSSRGSSAHRSGVTSVPAVNKDLLWMDTHMITIPRRSDGFGFSVTGGCPVQISKVEPGSSADAATLQTHDCIVTINGQNVSRSCCSSVAKIVKNTRNTLVLGIQRSASHLPPPVESPTPSAPKSILHQDVLVHSITSERYSPPPLRLEDLQEDWSHDEAEDTICERVRSSDHDDLSSVNELNPMPNYLFGRDIPFTDTSTPIAASRAHKRSGRSSSSNDSFEIHDSVLSDNMEVFKMPMQPVNGDGVTVTRYNSDHKPSKSKPKRVKPLSRLEAQLHRDLECIRENMAALRRTKRTSSEEQLSSGHTVSDMKQTTSMWNIQSDVCNNVPRTRENTQALAIDSMLLPPRPRLVPHRGNVQNKRSDPLKKKDRGVQVAVYDKENMCPPKQSSCPQEEFTPFDVETLQPIKLFRDFTATQYI